MRPLLALSLLFMVEVGCTADNADLTDAATSGDLSMLARSDAAGMSADAATGADMGPAGDMTCAPTTMACGNCGTAKEMCVDGKLVVGACMGEGACKAGDVQYLGACDSRTCGTNCQWGFWGPKAGAACANGTTQTCDAGTGCGHIGHYHCLPTCKWSTCMCD